MRSDAPFVFLEDARPGGGPGRLFSAPREIISADQCDDVAPALERVRAALRAGLYAAGWIGYEAGLALEEKLLHLGADSLTTPLLWFGLFEHCEEIAAAEVESLLPDPLGAWLSKPRPRMAQAQYRQAFARAQDYILSGDVYQINLSYRADVTVLGHPLAAYAQLRRAGRGGWSGVVFDGLNWFLSTSPELFFRIENGAIEARPMKGTALRAADPEDDRRAAARLQADPKERAENVMIVDLLRNDISRVAETGSVHAPVLFSIETYPTLHALTSTVRGRLGPGQDAVDAMLALFPCGSVTGAPKIRAMEIIDELEMDRRGVYTGSIGWFSPGGDAEFNVSIRTLTLADGKAELGLGSGVVSDSDADREWEECRAKGAFLTAQAAEFDLIETMRFEPDAGLARLDLHLERLRRSASVFDFPFNEDAIRASLNDALAEMTTPCVARLTLSALGVIAISFRPIPSGAAVLAALTPLPVQSSDFRLRHKTTLRDFYDHACIAAKADEVVFVDADGFVTEGSISNVFVERDSVLITPPAHRGLLPGVLRAELLSSGRAQEGDLRTIDLMGGFFIGNSVRGLVQASLRA